MFIISIRPDVGILFHDMDTRRFVTVFSSHALFLRERLLTRLCFQRNKKYCCDSVLNWKHAKNKMFDMTHRSNCKNGAERLFLFQRLHSRGSFDRLVLLPAETVRGCIFGSCFQSWSSVWQIEICFQLSAHPLIPHSDMCAGKTRSTRYAPFNQAAVKSNLDGWSDGLLWLATLANQGEKRHLYSNSMQSATRAVPRGVEAFARTNADLAASLSK